MASSSLLTPNSVRKMPKATSVKSSTHRLWQNCCSFGGEGEGERASLAGYAVFLWLNFLVAEFYVDLCLTFCLSFLSLTDGELLVIDLPSVNILGFLFVLISMRFCTNPCGTWFSMSITTRLQPLATGLPTCLSPLLPNHLSPLPKAELRQNQCKRVPR